MNEFVWLAGAAVALVLFYLLFRRSRAVEADEVPPMAVRPQPVAPAVAAAPVPLTAPPELLAFVPARADALPAQQRQEMFMLFRRVPRPPKLMQQLLSPDFLNTASSAQLVDLIAAEPLLAARLLAVVNSPAYGLSRPAQSIDQAVMLLGVNAVRAICLQYMLLASFEGGDGARAQRLAATWQASALASELAQHLGQALHLESPGATVSALVLSFLGRLAIKGTVTEQQLAQIPREGFLARSVAEQHLLGLTAGEIGRLLMTEWGLPAEVVADAAGVDAVLTRPADPSWPEADGRQALCYFCARVGERLADGKPFDGLEQVMDEAPADFFRFRAYLAHPWLRNLATALADPALAEKLLRMRASLQLG